MQDSIAMIQKERNGHTYRWYFRERDAGRVAAIIAEQCEWQRPGFEFLHTSDALSAMTEAGIAAQFYKAELQRSGR